MIFPPEWGLQVPPSRIYTNLGHASVLLFFMITGFLFSLKQLRGRSEPINWYKLVCLPASTPLAVIYPHACSVGSDCRDSHGITELQGSKYALAKGIVKWSSFTVLGAPDLNGVEKTAIIVAGVTWTLAYEWLFYLALPLLAVSVGVIAPKRFIVVGLGIVVLDLLCDAARTDLYCSFRRRDCRRKLRASASYPKICCGRSRSIGGNRLGALCGPGLPVRVRRAAASSPFFRVYRYRFR